MSSFRDQHRILHCTTLFKCLRVHAGKYIIHSESGDYGDQAKLVSRENVNTCETTRRTVRIPQGRKIGHLFRERERDVNVLNPSSIAYILSGGID